VNHDPDRRAFLERASALVGCAAAAWSCRSTPVPAPRDLVDLSAAEAVAAMRKGEVRAEDYAGALLDRAQHLERLNAFRVLDRDRVLQAARAADLRRASGARLGLLHGLPIPIKDSVNTAAYPTSNGTRALAAFKPKTDASVVRSLVAEGAIVMGKTNLHELSLGWTSNNLTFGAVHNPYDETKVPGGSSGGSAVAVAARMAPLAVAEDTLGSIRVPASMCGLCGLRPTFGRYADDGIMPLSSDKFDQVGPLARSVEDLVLFDIAATGDRAPLPAVDLAGVKIAVADFLSSGLDADVERVFTTALERLRAAGVTIVSADVPEPVKSALQVAQTIIVFEVAAAIGGFLDAHAAGVTLDQILEQAGADIQSLFKDLALPPARPPQTAYDAMMARRSQIRADIGAYFSGHQVEALAFPTVLIPPGTIGDESDVVLRERRVQRNVTMGRNVALGSCASLASLVLPGGTSRAGLPIGIEFDAPSGGDRRLLALGLSLQRALGPVAPARV
jgi:Asp-tRNA(Asn)/Glu-tRNA(Gln) amidotransferase A subunit family amidase